MLSLFLYGFYSTVNLLLKQTPTRALRPLYVGLFLLPQALKFLVAITMPLEILLIMCPVAVVSLLTDVCAKK